MAAARRLFCNRTLNLRSIRAVGYDMDYTLVNYQVENWERTAYEHVRRRFQSEAWALQDRAYDHGLTIRGLVVDLELGNVIKVNRFGFVKAGMHGTRMIDRAELRQAYRRTIVDMSEARYRFINTLFSMSEVVLYAQLVEALDEGRAPRQLSYAELHKLVRETMDHAHMEGHLKAEILGSPERFVRVDPKAARVLLDQRLAGKKLALITNSEWTYTDRMMRYCYEPYLDGRPWPELFDLIVVEAQKPAFFLERRPAFEVISPDGTLRTARDGMQEGKIYLGGDADQVERCLGVSGDELLYIGDHLFSDVHLTKQIQRWRTGLVVPELEAEVAALEESAPDRARLEAGMQKKDALERALNQARLERRALEQEGGQESPEYAAFSSEVERLKLALSALDADLKPLAARLSHLSNERWGLLMRTGNDKSYFARQVERYADVYMPAVSDLGPATPYAYLRSARGSLPHDA